jgi:hypothetical protein
VNTLKVDLITQRSVVQIHPPQPTSRHLSNHLSSSGIPISTYEKAFQNQCRPVIADSWVTPGGRACY